ncbi:MAG: hypothetical protein EBS75_03925 [Betaproteobacteria bacterium]|nr:hypothetical protein [Betaproteobacteria bacterium]NBU00776.1 hypothetical protein [Betaproteobacteria bacterium]
MATIVVNFVTVKAKGRIAKQQDLIGLHGAAYFLGAALLRLGAGLLQRHRPHRGPVGSEGNWSIDLRNITINDVVLL